MYAPSAGSRSDPAEEHYDHQHRDADEGSGCGLAAEQGPAKALYDPAIGLSPYRPRHRSGIMLVE
jgi:hypothetical protein